MHSWSEKATSVLAFPMLIIAHCPNPIYICILYIYVYIIYIYIYMCMYIYIYSYTTKIVNKYHSRAHPQVPKFYPVTQPVNSPSPPGVASVKPGSTRGCRWKARGRSKPRGRRHLTERKGWSMGHFLWDDWVITNIYFVTFYNHPIITQYLSFLW